MPSNWNTKKMTYVKLYHNPIKNAYIIVKTEAPDLDDEAALQAAVKSVNDFIGSDGLVRTILVYGALTRLGLEINKPTP